ncbi:hypothetical protein J437_LFUL003178 [Ladona fulva]|uniref:Uncharacterized protein n=1 Tax=Ladona fulva TaxID=123851 RepID=A0A8K0JXE2_LADFU|nr:hypothetical protein J437_LFUL003178 [Ladona fulva]
MAGLVFLVCIPTPTHERRLRSTKDSPVTGNLIRLDQEDALTSTRSPTGRRGALAPSKPEPPVPMERVLEELLNKLQIDNVTWYKCKNENFYQVMFPVPAGDPCENCLHYLSELGIGKKLNSIVSVVPCNVFKQGFGDEICPGDGPESADAKGGKAWIKFVDSVRSKLTVAQVVDGVRSSGELTFDFVLLVLTAGMIAAMGLIENSSVNIVAAMLVSPLMGPIVTATFGVVIADRKLQLIGIRTELTGLGLCLLFGFIFGLIVGSAENPWGTGEWPTSEMKGRRVFYLQGMMWGLACNVLMYPDTINIPYIPGDDLINRTTSYVPLYSDYIPTELAILGCISFCLTLVNIACIFIAAIIVLKIKEVASPYTSSPDMRRFWEHDIKVTREYNRSMMLSDDSIPLDISSNSSLKSMPREELLQKAVMEAVNDDTFRKVRRVSYYQQSTPEASIYASTIHQ